MKEAGDEFGYHGSTGAIPSWRSLIGLEYKLSTRSCDIFALRHHLDVEQASLYAYPPRELLVKLGQSILLAPSTP